MFVLLKKKDTSRKSKIGAGDDKPKDDFVEIFWRVPEAGSGLVSGFRT